MKGDRMKTLKDTPYWDAWAQACQLHKRYYGVRTDNEQRWRALDKECEQLDKQYENKPERKFMQSLLLAIVAELERNGNGETTGATPEA